MAVTAQKLNPPQLQKGFGRNRQTERLLLLGVKKVRVTSAWGGVTPLPPPRCPKTPLFSSRASGKKTCTSTAATY
jgi:hypothetical protein